jgi:glycosyltransferase involved in cell wall biosynthesis
MIAATTPTISVVLPVKNAAPTVGRAIRSVLSQTRGDFELLVIDDHSTDSTRTLLEDAAQHDARVRVVDASGSGVTAALNQGIALAQGEFIARHDADDESLPDRFARQTRALEQRAELCGIGCFADAVNLDGDIVGRLPGRHGASVVREDIVSIRATPVHGAMMLRRQCLLDVGGYRTAFVTCQDFDLWLRLLERWELDNVPQVLYRWRLSETSAYGARRINQLMFGGIADAFAEERRRHGTDSYALLEQAGGDLETFATSYPLEPRLRASWGNLLLRGVNDAALAHRHLRLAVNGGQRDGRTLAMWAWTALGLPWIGSRPLRAAANASATGRSR